MKWGISLGKIMTSPEQKGAFKWFVYDEELMFFPGKTKNPPRNSNNK